MSRQVQQRGGDRQIVKSGEGYAVELRRRHSFFHRKRLENARANPKPALEATNAPEVARGESD